MHKLTEITASMQANNITAESQFAYNDPEIAETGLGLSPLALYIHIPWCIKKCPYCDFNSHALKNSLPETEYLAALLVDLKQELTDLKSEQIRPLHSIFFGGGTPSLISPRGIGSLLNNIVKEISFSPNIEITLETNPGTVEHHCFHDYRAAGITRISLGAQSFIADKLQALGRIHKVEDTFAVIEKIKQANFNSFNLDLMYGLPEQNLDQAMQDLTAAIACEPPHISWYNLTFEPNTPFYHKPPARACDDIMWEMQQQGEIILQKNGYRHYEISAFSKPQHQSKHNLNYWQFGDYLGIGAGAHGKITDQMQGIISRRWKVRHPKAYLDSKHSYLAGSKVIPRQELPFEFMLNQLRLYENFNLSDFTAKTGLQQSVISHRLEIAEEKELIVIKKNNLQVTALGRKFLNDLLQIFIHDL